MKYPEFTLETYLAAREFTAPYNFCGSDLETLRVSEIIQMADEETLRLWNSLELHYTEPKGLPQLRREIARQYAQSIGSENVLCFAGAEEGIYAMAHALLDANDHAVVVTPCYQSLEALPSSICSTTRVPLHYEKQWTLDLHAIEQALQPNTKLIVINFPHNPTGSMMTHEQQAALVRLARERDIWIFSDEVYRLLELNAQDRLPPMADLYEKALSLGVMSKAYGLAGLRLGWIVSQSQEILRRIGEIKHYLSICNSAPSEVLALMALRGSDRILSRNMRLVQKNIALLDEFFASHGEWFAWVRPKAGCTGYPLFKGAKAIDRLADDLLKAHGVLLLPSSVYNDPSNHFRISFGRKNMPAALERLSLFVERESARWERAS